MVVSLSCNKSPDRTTTAYGTCVCVCADAGKKRAPVVSLQRETLALCFSDGACGKLAMVVDLPDPLLLIKLAS
jgi:hypothetical protein